MSVCFYYAFARYVAHVHVEPSVRHSVTLSMPQSFSLLGRQACRCIAIGFSFEKKIHSVTHTHRFRYIHSDFAAVVHCWFYVTQTLSHKSAQIESLLWQHVRTVSTVNTVGRGHSCHSNEHGALHAHTVNYVRNSKWYSFCCSIFIKWQGLFNSENYVLAVMSGSRVFWLMTWVRGWVTRLSGKLLFGKETRFAPSQINFGCVGKSLLMRF